jgi:hypothetical protein
MSDNHFGSIYIGGPMRRAHLPGLVEVLKEENPCDGNQNALEIETPSDLAKYLVEAGHLHFCDYDARAGRFPDLEDFLEKRGIPYDRFSEGHREYDAVRVFYRPGMEEPVDRFAVNSGMEMVPRDDARELLKIQDVKTLHARLREMLGPEVAPLPVIDPSIFEPPKKGRRKR